MTKLYRICTEAVLIEDVKRIVDAAFDASTVIFADGRWKGIAEDSMIIEIIATEYDRSLIQSTAMAIKQLNKQEAVLIQVLDCEMEMI
jgi:hypothetical protein